jgi:N-acylglucosamine 2-epimerase
MGAVIGSSAAGVALKGGQLSQEIAPSSCSRGAILPESLAGMRLEALRDDYRRRLFEFYLPFWEKGGCDQQYGGFLCELNDDGTVADDEKSLWYQGRGIWVYSFLYNGFGKDPHWLDLATRAKQFMVKHMYAGEGRWNEKTRRDGTVLEGVGKSVFGDLFAAAGLVQFYAAARDPKDLELAQRTVWAAMRAYDDPHYADIFTPLYTAVKVPPAGVRSQGHSMVLVWLLTQLLTLEEDPALAELQKSQVDFILHRFWNGEYGIANEYLRHDYSRLPETAAHMYAGHALESLWIVMQEALRIKDRALFDAAQGRIRRLLEMCWDYVFAGWGSGDYFVFASSEHSQGPDFSVKTMWAHCEVMVACMMVLEYTGEAWAKQWYERVREYTLRTMPVAEHGVWRQAVDRRGNDKKRAGISTKRKDNFHQARMMMLNLLSLDRMIRNQGRVTPFPEKAEESAC